MPITFENNHNPKELRSEMYVAFLSNLPYTISVVTSTNMGNGIGALVLESPQLNPPASATEKDLTLADSGGFLPSL